jgi:hypothetical protein
MNNNKYTISNHQYTAKINIEYAIMVTRNHKV